MQQDNAADKLVIIADISLPLIFVVENLTVTYKACKSKTNLMNQFLKIDKDPNMARN